MNQTFTLALLSINTVNRKVIEECERNEIKNFSIDNFKRKKERRGEGIFQHSKFFKKANNK